MTVLRLCCDCAVTVHRSARSGSLTPASLRVCSITVFSFPVTCPGDGTYQIVQGLNVSAAKQEAIKATEAELVQEKADADDILAGGK